jgi:uncharacterized protein
MEVLANTTFVYALLNSSERNHDQARKFYSLTEDTILFPTIALPELSYLATRDGGAKAVISVLRAFYASDFTLMELMEADHRRMFEILEKYHDTRIDFVDACIMALAERLPLKRILTFDHRDFGIFRPAHVERFELLP